MLNERQLMLVVSSAMSKYSAENNGRKGAAKKDIIAAVAQYGGDADDVRKAMIGCIKRIASDQHILFS